MKTKIIASILLLGLSASILMFMFVIGCGTSPTGGRRTISIPRIYISDYTHKKVLIINPSSLTIVGSIELTGATAPKWMAIHPNKRKVYVADEALYPASIVYVINTATNTLTDIVTVCSTPRGMAFNTDGSKLFVVSASAADVAIVDTATDTFNNDLSDTIWNFGTDNYGIAYNPKYNKVYVASYGSNLINIATAEGNATATSVSLNCAYDVAVGPGGTVLYATTFGSTPDYFLVSYEASTMTIVHSFEASSAGYGGFRNIAISPNGHLLYAGNHDYSYIDYLDLSNPSTLEPININAGSPDYNYLIEQIAFSSDSSKAFVVNQSGTSELVVVDTGTKQRVGSMALPAASYFGIVYKP